MLKLDELVTSTSCLNKAADDEPIFVLRAHDSLASITVRSWVRFRVRRGKNMEWDPEIQEALALADQMDAWRSSRE